MVKIRQHCAATKYQVAGNDLRSLSIATGNRSVSQSDSEGERRNAKTVLSN